MRYFLYNLLLFFLAPPAAAYLLCSAKYRPLLQRFRPALPSLSRDARPIWIHACSVGEVAVAVVLIGVLQKTAPNFPVVLSVSTLAGMQIAKERVQAAHIVWAPFDLLWSVRRFVRRLHPAALVIVETELWPNLIREARRQEAPVLIVNGRISPRKYPKYKKWRRFMPPVLSHVSLALAQDAVYAQRFVSLGMSPDAVAVAGNMKFDAVAGDVPEEERHATRQQHGFSPDTPIIIFGSTRPGDEELALSCWNTLSHEYPDLHIVIAPRHLQRLDEVVSVFHGYPLRFRSKGYHNQEDISARIFILDVMGELTKFYATATIAVIGGSFFPGVEGHNPLESAALGIPTVFGTYMGNFPEAAAMLLNAGGALQVESAEELLSTLRKLINDSALRAQVAARGRDAIQANKGSTQKNVEYLMRYLP